MKDRREHKETIEVPKGTGRAGFMLALEQILRLSRVQDIHIDARGKITFTRYISDEKELVPLQVDFETLMPSAAIRNGEMVEISAPDNIAGPVVISRLFNEVSNDQLFPIAFVGGAQTQAWDWMKKTTGLHPPRARDEFFGLPFYLDRKIEDYVLVLCAAYARNSALIDTQKSYKIAMPTWAQEAAARRAEHSLEEGM